MARKKRNQPTNVIAESATAGGIETAGDVSKELRGILAKCAVAVLSAVALSLMTPLEPGLLAGSVLLLLTSVVSRVVAQRAIERRRTAANTVSAVFLVAACLWACFAPVWLYSPRYISFKSEPFSVEEILKGQIPTTELVNLSERANAGRILLVGDPIRKLLLPLNLGRWTARSGVLELPHRTYLGRDFVLFPLSLAFHYKSESTNIVYQPTFAPKIGISFRMEGKKHSVGISYFVNEGKIVMTARGTDYSFGK